MRATRCRNVLLWKRGSKGVHKAALMSWSPYVLVRKAGAQGSKSRFKAATEDSRQQVKIAEATAPATNQNGAQLKRNEWAVAEEVVGRRWEVRGVVASAGVIASAAGLSSVLCWWSGVGAVASPASRPASPPLALLCKHCIMLGIGRLAPCIAGAYSLASPTGCTRHASTVHPCTRPCFHTGFRVTCGVTFWAPP
jgi:hypothetical protein